MNDKRVLEALERAQYGTGDEDEMFDDRAILAETVRELAWLVSDTRGHMRFIPSFYGDNSERIDNAMDLAAAIMEETYE